MLRLVAMAVTLLFAVGGLELWMRGASTKLVEPLVAHDLLTQRKLDQMAALAASGSLDTVFVGPSTVFFGIDPAVVDEAVGAGHRSYNAALNRGLPVLNEVWVREVVLPLLRPRLLVLGLSAVDFNDNETFGPTRLHDYRQAQLDREPLRLKMHRWGRHLLLLRYLPFFASPRRLLGALRILVSSRPVLRYTAAVTGLVDERGTGCECAARSYRNGPGLLEKLRTEVFVDYADRGRQREVNRQIIAEAHARGVRVAVVVMPFYREALTELMPVTGRDLAAVDDRTAELARAEGAAFAHPDVVRGPEHFADVVHLNGIGRALFSAALAHVVREVLQADDDLGAVRIADPGQDGGPP